MSGTERGDAGWALALAVAILGWFLGLFVLHGLRFPVGPDAPVYLWWTRLAGSEGLSAVGHRPGVPALTLVLEGTLHVSVVSALAALECAVPVALGLSAAALVRSSGGGRPAWALAGALAGTFAVHLAAGYVSTRGFEGRFLRAWGLVTVRGVAVAFASGLAPADRFITFGFVVPILAALGLVDVWRWLPPRRGVALVAAGALTVAML